MCRKVHTVALAIAAREKAPRGRNLAADAHEIMRLMDMLGDYPKGRMLGDEDMRSLTSLRVAYSVRNT